MTMTEAVSRDSPAVLPQERWVQLSLLPPFGFTLFFFLFYLFVLFCLLSVCVSALGTESSVKSLALPEPHFSLLGSGVPQGQV